MRNMNDPGWKRFREEYQKAVQTIVTRRSTFERFMKPLLIVSAVVLFCAHTYAQDVTAGIYGEVHDSAGASVAKPAIELREINRGTKYSTVGNEDGSFTLTLIPVGVYDVTARAPGFNPSIVNGLHLDANENKRINFNIQVAGAITTVTVTNEVASVNTTNATLETTIPDKQLLDLPSPDRGVMPFATLLPAAVSTDPTSPANNYTSIAGIRPTQNEWMLDGASDIDTGGNWNILIIPNVEMVQEFQAVQSSYSAEFGTSAGAQFNVITKSGTNQLHGSAYEFLRNDALNAQNAMNPVKTPDKENQFGFSLGGPVILPHIYNGRNKTFFFTLFGWQNVNQQSVFKVIVPTEAERGGDFRALNTQLVDPWTGAPIPGNVIPSSERDANGMLVAGLYQNPNYSDAAGNNYIAYRPYQSRYPEENIRIDHDFNSNHRVLGRYSQQRNSITGYDSPGFTSFDYSNVAKYQQLVVDYTWVLSPSKVNDVNFVFNHNSLVDGVPGLTNAGLGLDIEKIYGINASNYPYKDLNLSQVPDTIPAFNISNYQGISIGAPWANYEYIYQGKDSFTWMHGHHAIKIGGSYAWENKFEPSNSDVFGTFTFEGKSGDAFADMLLGYSYSYNQLSAVTFNDNRRKSLEAYVDDSWKTTRKLSVDVGVRYSFFPPAYERNDRYRIFDASSYSSADAVTVNTDGTVTVGSGNTLNGIVNPAGKWNYSKRNFAPRIGLAYDPYGDGKSSIRAGYGIFFGREILGAYILSAGNPPWGESTTLYGADVTNPVGGRTGATFTTGLNSINLNQLSPYTQQWNLSIERQLNSVTALQIAYAGEHSAHMMMAVDENQALPNLNVAAGRVSADYYRPYKGFGTISDRREIYGAKYNSLQVVLHRRMAHNFNLDANYTWSKALDNSNFDFGGIYNPAPNSYNLQSEWGPSQTDARHNFHLTYVYEVGKPFESLPFLNSLIGGWKWSGTGMYQTGLPINITFDPDVAGVGMTGVQRPVVSGDARLGRGQRGKNEWFNTSLFSLPAEGTFSETHRNLLNGPGWVQWNMSLNKEFSIKERAKFEFRIDAFNAFNHTEYSAVGTDFSTSSSFGKITSTKFERNLQLSGRFSF